MSTPIVSVLMSVHNGERYLREAVESILDQSLSDFEFIVVDDGSTDNSSSILEFYNDPRLRIIRQSQNKGLAAALNLAASHAAAPLFARMDADDVALPERLKRQAASFASAPDLVLLGSVYDIIDGDGRLIGHQHLPVSDEEIRQGLFLGNKFAHPTVMMRAAAFHTCGGYRDIGGRYAQDYDLWLRMAEQGRMGNLEPALLRYRVHEHQVSIDKLLVQREAAELYRQLAMQRSSIGHEDIATAQAAVSARHRQLRAECAAELLSLSTKFAREGRRLDSRRLRWRAFSMAPLSNPVWQEITSAIRWRWKRLRDTPLP